MEGGEATGPAPDFIRFASMADKLIPRPPGTIGDDVTELFWPEAAALKKFKTLGVIGV